MPINLIIYAVMFLAVAGVIGGTVYKVKKWGGDEVRAELQPKLDACTGEIKKQNDALAVLAKEQAAKQAAASKALAKAAKDGKVWEDNAVRLQAVLTSRNPDGDKSCAGAWAEIRKPK